MTRVALRTQSVDISAKMAVDLDVSLDDVGFDLVDALALMEPFGVGNERPLFCARSHIVLATERVGKTGRMCACL